MASFENPGNKSEEGISRRDLLVGGAALTTGFAAGAFIEKVFPKNEEQIDLQEKLAAARAELPADAPVTLSITERGEIIYQHDDAETTEFINFLAGRGELTEKYVASALRGDMFNFLRGLGHEIDTKEARDTLYGINTKAELIKFYVDHFEFFSGAAEEEWRDNPEGLAEFRVNEMYERQIKVLDDISPKFYDALWKTYVNAGACKVSMVDSFEERPSYKNLNSGSASSFEHQANPPYMKIDLTGGYKKLLSAFLVESSHMNSFTNDKENFHARVEFQKKLLGSMEGLSREEVLEKRRLAYVTPGTPENYDHIEGLEILVRDLVDLNPLISEIIVDEKRKFQKMFEQQQVWLQSKGNSIE